MIWRSGLQFCAQGHVRSCTCLLGGTLSRAIIITGIIITKLLPVFLKLLRSGEGVFEDLCILYEEHTVP